MAKKIAILGSTGSIGVQTLDVAKNLNLQIVALTANNNIDLLEKQAREYKPKYIAVKEQSLYGELKKRLEDTDVDILAGEESLIEIAKLDEVDTVVVALVGISGLIPTLCAIRNKKNVALANKETLVTAGEIVINEAKINNVDVFPIDSEHSAVLQCLDKNNKKEIKRIILTASGGPFRGKTKKYLKGVTLEQALKHPNWTMGNKITIDSATLMNKGLEVIEAKWLFNVGLEKIDVVIHPESVIHSMVEYNDNSIIAQLGSPDMRIPIQLALTYPDRVKNDFKTLDLLKVKSLNFEEPDFESFPCLRYAYMALKEGGTMPAVMNAANEIAVEMFLKEKIEFLDIPRIIETEMGKHNIIKKPSLEDIIEADRKVRETLKY